MNSQEFDRALETISDPLIDSAARAYDRGKRRPGYKKYLRIAAAAAAVVILLCVVMGNRTREFTTMPCAFGISTHEYTSEGKFVEHKLSEDTVHQAWPAYDRTMNIVPGLPLTFSTPEDASYTYEISVSHGQFIDWMYDITPDYGLLYRGDDNGDLGQSFTLSQTRTVYWRPWETDPETNKVTTLSRDITENIFVEVIVRTEGYIVGFAVLEIFSPGGESIDFCIKLLDSASYPMVEGEFQAVTNEYIAKQFAKAER